MAQTIDPVKLKAAAEHLEWVLQQYPHSDDVQSLLHSLAALIKDAKASRIIAPIDSMDVPGAWNFGDGRYVPYKSPSVGGAYADFITELEGGLTEQDQRQLAEMEAYRQGLREAKS